MIDLFRSEEMQLMQLLLPSEAAHGIVHALGEIGALQFKDLNSDKSAFQRTYANQVKRCDELARKLRFFSEQIRKSDVVIAPHAAYTKDLEFDELESKLEDLEKELLDLNANNERLHRTYNELIELQLVLETAGSFFEDARGSASRNAAAAAEQAFGGNDIGAPLLTESALENKAVKLGFVSGLVQTEKLLAFERLLFRATRGNMYLKSQSVGAVSDPATGERQEKSVFVVYFAGERSRAKILKICDAYGANRYPFPEETARQQSMNSEVTARLRELHTTIDTGERYRENLLQSIANKLDLWVVQVNREKAVYHTMNKLSVDVTRKVLVGEAWCPVTVKPRVQEALRRVSAERSLSVGTIFQPIVTFEPPPTHFVTSKFTSSFQAIVSSYGVARYREVNPATFTIITFPFLFAVMFGDLGHGVLLTLFAAYMVIMEKSFMGKDLGDIFSMCFGGRYVILLMGIFSMYTGVLYNEVFAIPMNLFGSNYACPSDPSLSNPVDMMFEPSKCPEAFERGGLKRLGSVPYPIGIDPIWAGSATALSFLNSVKMKMSILLGVFQMDVGIILSYLNQSYFRDTLSTLCEFIPQMIFLNALFGYLCFLIILKWISGSTADLYHVMIYMFLSPGNVDCGGECPENVLYPGMGTVQVILVLVAVAAVPVMLLPKPFILKRAYQRQSRQALGDYGLVSTFDDHGDEVAQALLDEEAQPTPPAAHAAHGHGGHGHGEEFNFGDVMVHQMIHSIEFVLGAVSNTASYLRLWALSLAHSQLSAVFYERVMLTGIKAGNPIFVFIAFFVFACATLGVLMVMETLSAFLHGLRLHWVEFQNKFYHGDGYEFTPFSFELVDKDAI